tara:strand:+ start:2386 stop:3939 length:1554 start_codon:yes stop_codon:yes gene_type:complete
MENWNRFLAEHQKDPLLEGRKDDVIKKYGKKLSEEALQLIIDTDKPNNYKHLRWMAKQLSKIDSPEEQTKEAKRLAQGIEDFVDNIQQMKIKSIDRYKSIDDLINSIYQDVKMSRIKRARKKRKDNKLASTLIDDMEAYHVYEDERFFVIKPDTLMASCYFGRKTRWCISQYGNTQWDKKISEGATFYFIKDDTKKEDDFNAKLAVEVTGEDTPYFDRLWDRYDTENPIESDSIEDLASALEEMEIPPKTAMAIAKEISNDYTFGSDIVLSYYDAAKDYDDFMYAMERDTKMADAMMNIAAGFNETDPKILEYMSTKSDLDVKIKRKLAGNLNASRRVLTRMMRDRDSSVKAAAVGNKNIGLDVMMSVAKDKSEISLHNILVKKPDLPEEILKTIMSHRNYNTIKVLASGDNAIPEALIHMASLAGSREAKDLVNRPDLPPAALEVLASRYEGDSNRYGSYDALRGEVRAGIVQHPNTTSRAIAKLVTSDPQLKKFARRTKSRLPENKKRIRISVKR